MHKNTGSVVLLVLGCLYVCSIAGVQSALAVENEDRGKVGISASLQGGQTDFEIPIWLNDTTVIAPNLGFVMVSDVGMDLSVGLFVRKNSISGDLCRYFGFRGIVLKYIPDEGDGTMDFILGPALGGEYFFHPHWSMSVEAQFNITISDEFSNRFSNPDGVTINTGTALLATYYF